MSMANEVHTGFEQPQLDLKIELPVFDDSRLRMLHEEGWNRVGVLGLVLDSEGNALFLQHAASDKNPQGAWGTLGETSLTLKNNEEWVIENPLQTLIRGMQEELGVPVSVNDIRMPERSPFFHMGWPVGTSDLNESAFAICPVVVISNELKTAILASGPTEEIDYKIFAPLDTLAKAEPMRHGTDIWIKRAVQSTADNLASHLSEVQEPPVLGRDHPLVQDAILVNMYGPNVPVKHY